MIIDDLLRGSIDMHCHHTPNAVFECRLDALDTARYARQMGMRGLVLKNTFFPTAPLATMVNQLVPEVKVFGSVCLDSEIGGLNYEALEPLAQFGTKVVWMPTHSATNSRNDLIKLPGVTSVGDVYSLLTTENKLIPEVDRILAIIKKYNMVLANGHISPRETFALLEAAQKIGITKVIITHGLWVNGKEPFKLEELYRLGQMGAYIEHCYVGFLPNELREDPQPMVKAIKHIGAEHCIISTDLGQYYNPPPAEGMRMFMALLLKHGITENEIMLMAKVNPSKLLDLD
jgi:Family of unknown function (DUF6282)